MKRSSHLPTLVFLMLLLPGLPAYGQKSLTEGLFLNVHVNRVTWTEDRWNDSTMVPDGGYGLGMGLGYGFSRHLSVFLNTDIDRLPDEGEENVHAHGDLGLQLTFGRGNVYPYLMGAVTGRLTSLASDSARIDLRGGGFTFGAGLRYFVTPFISIDGGVTRSIGKLHRFEDDAVLKDVESFNAYSVRINAGISWYPGW